MTYPGLFRGPPQTILSSSVIGAGGSRTARRSLAGVAQDFLRAERARSCWSAACRRARSASDDAGSAVDRPPTPTMQLGASDSQLPTEPPACQAPPAVAAPDRASLAAPQAGRRSWGSAAS